MDLCDFLLTLKHNSSRVLSSANNKCIDPIFGGVPFKATSLSPPVADQMRPSASYLSKCKEKLIVIFLSFFILQAISQWTSTHVVEWMAALNLYRYAELFRSKDIKGVDLLSLDKDKLTVIPPSSLFPPVFIDGRWTALFSSQRLGWVGWRVGGCEDLLAMVLVSYRMAFVCETMAGERWI